MILIFNAFYCSTQMHNTLHVSDFLLPVAEKITQSAANLDLVGVWASGQMARGFTHSMEQFNWRSHCNFNKDRGSYNGWQYL